MSGVFAARLCLFGIATFDVQTVLLSDVRVTFFVSVLLLTVICAPVTNTSHKSVGGCSWPAL